MLTGEWLAKLQRYTQADELVVRPNPKKAMAPSVAVQAEGERVLKALRPQVKLAHACCSYCIIPVLLVIHTPLRMKCKWP